jgi:hypothetical protein
MDEACAGRCDKVKKVTPIGDGTWREALLRRSIAIYTVLKAREAAKLKAFVKDNKALLDKVSELTKKATVFAFNAQAVRDAASYKAALAMSEINYKSALMAVESDYKSAVIAAELRDLKNLLFVTASEAGVVRGEYVRKDPEEVEKRDVTKVVVKKPKAAKRPKLSGYVFDPGNQVFDPRKQGDLPRFLGQSKHQEYQDLLAEFEDLKLGVNLEDRPAALAAIRAFREVSAPTL